MTKTFKLFLVLSLTESFLAFFIGSVAMAATQLDYAGFHNGEAVKTGNQLLDREGLGQRDVWIIHTMTAIKHAKAALVHAEKEYYNSGKGRLEKYISELTDGIGYLQSAIDYAMKGRDILTTAQTMANAKKGMKFIKKCQKDIVAMGAKKL
ncbi:MAG TPA: hypothetical protein QF468_00155 [Nitrospinota bacterium]|jgi:hypothetical protein|nr:hypothetical protein [Nitrospinota bacterium]|tara:strand:+ start:3125 stop:3577 length:453 start_codon:yes stop_codon:yes gene_type:complete